LVKAGRFGRKCIPELIKPTFSLDANSLTVRLPLYQDPVQIHERHLKGETDSCCQHQNKEQVSGKFMYLHREN
jgi:hypothetical protein